ncbi:MAG TPA: S8 family serine peptidase [Gemmatimonadaceae bacterium]|nr:S8 family serine peptidase [Gemmatimonadaceae bacterium]
MNSLDLVNLTPLMARSSGAADVVVGLIDGPVAVDRAAFARARIREIPAGSRGSCARASSAACIHGTFVAGMLAASRGSAAPAICPGCTLLVRPIFSESVAAGDQVPSATPKDLTAAILDCIAAGARVLNLSVAVAQPTVREEREMEGALDLAMRRGVVVVAAAGNQGMLGSSAITRQPWVIPVAACDDRGRPIGFSNYSTTVGRRGLSAPGEGITSLGTGDDPVRLGGTSVAAPFVTGAVALLWSLLPSATAGELRVAIGQGYRRRRAAIVPPLLNAWAAYQSMLHGRAGATARVQGGAG